MKGIQGFAIFGNSCHSEKFPLVFGYSRMARGPSGIVEAIPFTRERVGDGLAALSTPVMYSYVRR